MNPVNYHETIVIPTLQKKLQELQTSHLFLEVSLLVEQAKVKDVDAYYKNQIGNIDALKQEVDSRNQLITSLKQQINALNDEKNAATSKILDLESKLQREVSVRDSINIEYSKLKMNFDNLQAEHEHLKTSINNKKVKEPKLV